MDPSHDPRTISPNPPLISEEEFQALVLFENERVLALDKPGWLVCHPSKAGPGSSLVGAAKRYLGTERVHLVSRLDRETSGIVVLAKDRGAARFLQMAVEGRKVYKSYQALLDGELRAAVTVDRRIVPDRTSNVRVKMRVLPTEADAGIRTHFAPHTVADRRTWCQVRTDGGRKHQIRVHAAFLGHPVTGDKLYGLDETLYLDFCRAGWTARHQSTLPLPRQALHCGNWEVENDLGLPPLQAPLPKDISAPRDNYFHDRENNCRGGSGFSDGKVAKTGWNFLPWLPVWDHFGPPSPGRRQPQNVSTHQPESTMPNAKKATTKKAAKKAAKKAVVKKAATKKSAVKKTARKTVAKKAGAPKSVANPPTRVIARVDVSFGNTLFIRGEGGGLSWDLGAPMENISPDEWAWETREADSGVVFKFLVNDEIWAHGEDHTVAAGGTSISTPVFY